jgi:two-component system chemotaxis sensor kinase CheA
VLEEHAEPVRILVTRYGASCFGLVVDSFENIEEVVVKPLPRYLKKIKCYSGASIMGNGTVALILDAAGIAEKANLHQLEAMKAESAFEAGEKAEKAETQTLLLFDNNTEERFALPLELITRIERVPSSQIEHIKDRQYLQYQGEKLRLLFLEDYLPITPPQRAEEDTVGVIIPKLVQNPMGIVINRVIDTVQEAVELDTETITAPGLFGSAVLDGKITLFPDMYRLFEMAEPELYARTEHKKDPGSVKNILLVDDVAFFRMVETDYLSSAGYCVFQADSGETALRILESERIDAVVLDIVMPGMDGWQVIERIRADTRFADLPVMAVTSLGDEEHAEKGARSGFSAWETKLNKERMLDKLEKMLQG